MSLDINAKLRDLLALSAENEVVEFKEAKNGYDFTKLGKYFSALGNEANLKHQRAAWLVLGVNDQRQVVGSSFRAVRKDLDSLKEEVANKTTNLLTELRRTSKIVNLGSYAHPSWALFNSDNE